MQHRDIFIFSKSHDIFTVFDYFFLLKAFSNDIFTIMTWFLFVFINQAKYYAQDTGNQYSILGRLFCLPDCDKTWD
jgi:hypothetical protein